MFESSDNWVLDDTHNKAVVTPTIKENMLITAKWTRFFGILGFLFNGLYLLLIILLGSEFFANDGSDAGVILLISLLGIALSFYTSSLVYQYGTSLRRVAKYDEGDALRIFFKKQKSFWRVLGIITLIIMVIYGFMFLSMLIYDQSALEQF